MDEESALLINGGPVRTQEQRDADVAATEERMNSKSLAANKYMALGAMDTALILSNIEQLRALVDCGSKAKYYEFNLSLVIVSIAIQIMVGVILIVMWHFKLRSSTSNMLSCIVVICVFLNVINNAIVIAFHKR